jgi:hypothetical protein
MKNEGQPQQLVGGLFAKKVVIRSINLKKMRPIETAGYSNVSVFQAFL